MGVDGVFIGLAQGGHQQTRFLHLAPGEIFIGKSAYKSLHRLQAFISLAGGGAGARHKASALGRGGGLHIKAFGQTIFIEYLEKTLAVIGPVAQIGHHPTAIFGMHNSRRGGITLARMAAGLAAHHRAAHHPRHQIHLGGNRHRLMHGARQQLPHARTEAIHHRRHNGHGKLFAGNVIGMPHLRRNRRQIIFATGRGVITAVHHHPAQREMDQIRTFEMRPRAIITKVRHTCNDEFWIFLQQALLP